MSLENRVPSERKLPLVTKSESTPAGVVRLALKVRSQYIRSSLIVRGKVDEGIAPDRLRSVTAEDSVGFTMEGIPGLDQIATVPAGTRLVFIAPAEDKPRILDRLRQDYSPQKQT